MAKLFKTPKAKFGKARKSYRAAPFGSQSEQAAFGKMSKALKQKRKPRLKKI